MSKAGNSEFSGEFGKTSFEEFFRKNFRHVVAFFARHGVDRHEAEDFAQEVFLRAYESRETYRGDSLKTTWIYEIGRNVLLNSLRARSAQKRGGQRTWLDIPVIQDSDSSGIASDDDPLRTVLDQESVTRVRNAVESLPPKMRQCVQMRTLDDMKYSEIADRLHISIQSVKSHLFEARQRLKALLGVSASERSEPMISHNITSPQSSERVSRQPQVRYRDSIEPFLTTTHGASPNTVAAYRRHLETFSRELDEGVLTSDALSDYRARLLRDGRGSASHRQALAAVRGFLCWLSVQDESPLPLPAKTIRRLLRLPAAEEKRPSSGEVNPEEVVVLLEYAPTARDRAMVGLFLGAGLRVAELVQLDIRDFQVAKDLLVLGLRQRKRGGEGRAVPLRPEVKISVAAYLDETGRSWESAGALFLPLPQRGGRPSRTGRLTARAVEYRLRQILEAAGIGEKKISPRSLRQTFATQYLQETGDLKGLQKLLGHVSIGTTSRYRVAA